MGHRDPREAILWLRKAGGGDVQVQSVPSHLRVHGNDEADALASMGRQLHPNNLVPLSKVRRVTEWDRLGLEPMAESEQLSDPDSSVDSRADSSEWAGMRLSSESNSNGFSTDVSERARGTAQQMCFQTVWESDYSTEVSDNVRRKGRRVIKSAPGVAFPAHT